MEIQSLLNKLVEKGYFDQNKHFAMWIHLSDSDINHLSKDKEEFLKNHHILNKALLLDLNVHEVQKDWHKASEAAIKILSESADRFKSLGEILFEDYPIRPTGENGPIEGVLVTLTMGNNNAETDNVLIGAIIQRLKGEAQLHNIDRGLPPFPGGSYNDLSAPTFDEVFSNS